MIRAILYALPLAAMWMAITGRFTIASFVIGYVISALLVRALFMDGDANTRLFKSAAALLRYMFRVLRDLIVADVRVTQQIITGKDIDSHIIEVPLSNDSNLDDDLVAALSSHAITLTPGTLVIDVDEENNTLLLHRLNAHDTDDSLGEEQRERAEMIGRIFHD
jgi:multicomponent Na+:H+ antiporter subunit E